MFSYTVFPLMSTLVVKMSLLLAVIKTGIPMIPQRQIADIEIATGILGESWSICMDVLAVLLVTVVLFWYVHCTS